MISGIAEKLSLDRPITTSGQLLVEGRVPEMFFWEMVAACGLANALETRTFGDVSKDNLRTYLELFTQKPAFKEHVTRLGIVRDAEAQAAIGAFQSVQAALREAGLTVPSQMRLVEGAPLAVGVFILPDCQNSGMLETFCLSAIAEKDESGPHGLLGCVDEFFVCLERRNRRPANATKARFAGYALAKDVIDPQLGRSTQQGAIPWDARAFDALKQFLKEVAGR